MDSLVILAHISHYHLNCVVACIRSLYDLGRIRKVFITTLAGGTRYESVW